jgi:hypothetical protein
MAAEIEKIAAEREAWEQGSFKKSNEELYAVLERCLFMYAEVKTSHKLRERLNVMLTERGIAFNSSTNTLTKIVRVVFGDCGKRAYTYARVLKVALREKPENKSLAAFITDVGGIEEVRRTQKGISPAKKREQAISNASRWMEEKSVIVKVESADELAPNSDATHSFSLAVVRQDADGTQSIVYGINNQALLNKALEYAGKQLATQQSAERILSMEDARTEAREDAVQAVAKKKISEAA